MSGNSLIDALNVNGLITHAVVSGPAEAPLDTTLSCDGVSYEQMKISQQMCET